MGTTEQEHTAPESKIREDRSHTGSSERSVIKGLTAGMVANYFLIKSFQGDKPVSPLKLLKLVYFAYGWWLGVMKQRLFDEPIEAWEHGPVIPSLYHEFKRYRWRPILEISHQFWVSDDVPEDASEDEKRNGMFMMANGPGLDEDSAAQLKQALDWVWELYSPITAVALSQLTHEEDTPWYKAREKGKQVLENREIEKHFSTLQSKLKRGYS